MIEFKVFSELYGVTDAVIHNIEQAIKIGYIPCGDGCDYKLSLHELEQLKSGNIEDFKPSATLPSPFNLIALMDVDGNRMLLPQTLRFGRKEYQTLKTVLEKAGGKYHKNSFVFEEPAIEVYLRLVGGEDYNLKKKYQYFPTPESLASYLVELADLSENDVVLEPSAGQGAIVKAITMVQPGITVDCVEIMEQNRTNLNKMPNVNIVGSDFLEFECPAKYTRVIANPPFSKNQDIEHIQKMFSHIAKGGKLVSIASTHWQHSTGKKETAFKNWLVEQGATIIQVEQGAFKESGTNVATVIIVIDKK